MSPELIAAVRERLAQGSSPEQVRATFVAHGHTPEVMDVAIKQVLLESRESIGTTSESFTPHAIGIDDTSASEAQQEQYTQRFIVFAVAAVSILLVIGMVWSVLNRGSNTSVKALWSSTPGKCPAEEPTLVALRGQVNTLRSNIFADQQVLEEIGTQMNDWGALSEEEYDALASEARDIGARMDRLAASYATSSSELVLAEVARLAESDIVAVYDRYCREDSTMKFYPPEYDTKANLVVTDMSTGGIVCDLQHAEAVDGLTHAKLNTLGFALMASGDMDRGLAFYACSAEEYANLNSMYRLAQLYYNGSDMLLRTYEGSDVTPNLSRAVVVNHEEAFYWLALLINLSVQFETEYVDSNTGLGWNTIAMFDQLTNGPEADKIDFRKVGLRVEAFLQAKFADDPRITDVEWYD